MKRPTIILTVLLICSVSKTHAQKDSTKLFQKIEKLLFILNLPSAQDANADTSAEQTIRNTPGLETQRDSTRYFFKKYMGWNALKTDMCRLYSRHYTEPELEELITFYSSSAGKKSLAAGNEIIIELQRISVQILQEHVNEINRLLPVKTPASKTHPAP